VLGHGGDGYLESVMLTRVLLALGLVIGVVAGAAAEDTKVIALGITDHAVTQEELAKGDALPVPRFNTPAVAYVLASDVKKGDSVEISLNNNGKSLMHNTETLAEDKAKFMLLVGKRGVPAGGWPEGDYSTTIKIARDGKTLIEKTSEPVKFE
jgi:hypothetical protein